jgi:tetratricopeptide (TPR) repeat protein
VLLAGSAHSAVPDLYQDSVDALYGLDFTTAERGFESLTRDEPGNPKYWNGLASTIWLRIIFEQQKLNMESFSGSSLGTKDSRDAINPADEKRLRAVVATAIEKADAILKKNPNDVLALYALGISNATLASFEGTAKRSYLAAHSKAKAARNLHERVLKIDANFHDAKLSIGAYHYVVGVIPGWIRLFIGLFGVRGAGKEEGIRLVETAAAQGKEVSTDAKMLLVVIYNREKAYDQALALANELHSKYPRNYLFELSKGSIYGKMSRWDQAADAYRQILLKVKEKRDGYERLREERVEYELANANIHAKKFDAAVDSFAHVVRSTTATPNEKAVSYLWMGKIFDSRGERSRALEQYNAVLNLNCDQGYKDEAQRHKRKPFTS